MASGVLNLTHRDSHETPEALAPGLCYAISFELDAMGHVVAPGHRLRLALSGSDWPNTWPAPYRATTTIGFGPETDARLVPPEIPGMGAADAPDLAPRRMPLDRYVDTAEAPTWTVTRDVATGSVTVTSRDASRATPDEGVDYASETVSTITASDRDPAAASCDTRQTFRLAVDGGSVETRGHARIVGSENSLHLAYDLTVTQNGEPFFRRSWRRDLPRHLV